MRLVGPLLLVEVARAVATWARRLAQHSDDADQTRRLLALAVICDGGSRGEAAELAGVGPQTVRDWVLRFNAEGPNGRLNSKAPGRVPLPSEVRRRELAEVIERGPDPAVDGWCAGAWLI